MGDTPVVKGAQRGEQSFCGAERWLVINRIAVWPGHDQDERLSRRLIQQERCGAENVLVATDKARERQLFQLGA